VASPTTDPKPGEDGYLAKVGKEVTDANAAISSDADGGEQPKSMLEAVQAALASDETKDGESPTPEDAGQADDADAPTEADADPVEGADEAAEGAEDGEEPPFHKHPRWQELKRERDGLKGEAEAFRGLQGFMQRANLTTDDVNVGFDMMAAIRNNPEKAVPLLENLLATLKVETGLALPADLQAKVESGHIDEDTAREFAQVRRQAAAAANASTRVESDGTAAKQARAREAGQAVSGWEAAKATSDPDWRVKRQRVQDKIELHFHKHGAPADAVAAVKLAQDSYDAVTKEMVALRPRKKPIVPAQAGGTIPATSKPKTMLEVVEAALR
jgi:hypothetical protein